MSKKSKIWYGYLNAGTKSSHVLLDPKLDTGDSKTLYLYNLSRDQVLEYNRDLIEPKLRELNGNESDIVDQLKKAYNKAKGNFTPRRSTSRTSTSTGTPAKPPAAEEPSIDDVDIDTGDIDIGDDIDINSDD